MSRRYDTHCQGCRCKTCHGWTRNDDHLPERECRCTKHTLSRWEAAYDAVQDAPDDLPVEQYMALRETEHRRRFEHNTAKRREFEAGAA